MLKIILITIIIGPIVAASLWGFKRYQNNPAGILPLPYHFTEQNSALALEAPLLIVGDRMAQRLAMFNTNLAATISEGMSKPIRIQSMAEEKQGLHRTLHALKKLEKWPRLLIYHGASEEFVEERFKDDQIPTIKKNLALFEDIRLQTAFILYPPLARLIYWPLNRIQFSEKIQENKTSGVDTAVQQRRSELLFKLYELELKQMAQLAREHKSTLMFITTPLNLDVRPKETCSNAKNSTIDESIATIRESIKQQDYKTAYNQSAQLSQMATGHAEAWYLHGQTAWRARYAQEAKEALNMAAALDCQNWRINPVFNAIIRKVAEEEQVMIFDYAQMMEDEWNNNATFFDDIFPHDLFYERATSALGVRIKKLLGI